MGNAESEKDLRPGHIVNLKPLRKTFDNYDNNFKANNEDLSLIPNHQNFKHDLKEYFASNKDCLSTYKDCTVNKMIEKGSIFIFDSGKNKSKPLKTRQTINDSLKADSISSNLISERMPCSQIPQKPSLNAITPAQTKYGYLTPIEIIHQSQESNRSRENKFTSPRKGYNHIEKSVPPTYSSNFHKDNCAGKIVKINLLQNEIYQRNYSEILFEGFLFKYTSGINQIYTKRFCRLTRKEFLYYKDKYSSEIKGSKPIISIPIYLIESINVINFVSSLKPKLFETQRNYMFEIYAPQVHIVKNSENAFKTPSKPNIQKRSLMNKSFQKDESKTISRCYSPEKGHLMRPIQSPNQSRIVYEDKANEKFVNRYIYNGILFKNIKESKEFEEFVSVYGNEISEPINVTEKTEYTFNSASYKKQTWTFREIDWYLSESRFVLCTDTKEECLKWVYLLHWLKNQ